MLERAWVEFGRFVATWFVVHVGYFGSRALFHFLMARWRASILKRKRAL